MEEPPSRRVVRSEFVEVEIPETWSHKIEEGIWSIWKPGVTGAVTISSYTSKHAWAKPDALIICRNFVTKMKAKTTTAVSGDNRRAYAQFEDDKGMRWTVRIHGAGLRYALITFARNAAGESDEAEAAAIMEAVNVRDD